MLKSVKLFALLIAIFTISACASNGEKKQVFANDIIVKQSVIEKVVGDEFKLSNQIIELSPYNAKIDSVRVVSGNNSIASYNEQTGAVLALHEGEAVIRISAVSGNNKGVMSYISKDITLVVLPKPVYVEDIAFESEVLSININEEFLFNPSTITLTSNKTVSFSELDKSLHIEENMVSYSKVGLINYNPHTGKITVLKHNINKSEEIEVTLRLMAGKMFTTTNSFKVVLTNNVYASNLTVEGLSFNNNVSENVVMFTNSKLSFGVNITSIMADYDYNLDFVALYNNQFLNVGYNSLLGEIEILSLNQTGNYTLVLQVKSGKDSFIEKTINLQFIEKAESLNITLLSLSNEEVTDFFVTNNFNYKLKINSNVLINKDDVTFFINGVEYKDFYEILETEKENEFLVKFLTANNLNNKILINYCQQIFNKTHIVNSNDLFVNLYDVVSDYNIYISQNGVFAEKDENDNNVVYLIDKDYSNLALSDNVVFNPNIIISPTNINTISDYNLFVLFNNNQIAVNNGYENNDFKIVFNELLNEYVFSPKEEGKYTFIIKSLDTEGFSKHFTIKTIENNVTGFDISGFNDNFYVNVHESNVNNYNSSYNLKNITALPKYAFNKQIAFSLQNNSAKIENNIITPINTGENQLIIENQNKSFSLDFNILPSITGINVKDMVGNNYTDNKNQLIVLRNRPAEYITLEFSLVVGNAVIKTDDIVVNYINNDGEVINSSSVIKQTNLNFVNILNLETSGYGEQVLRYSYTDKNAVFVGEILVVVDREFDNITDIAFDVSKETISINLSKNNSFENNFTVFTERNMKYDENLISVSSDSNFVEIVSLTSIMFNISAITNYPALVTITITAITDHGIVSDYYMIYAYNEHITNINKVIFEEDDIVINTFYETDINNNATIVKENPQHITEDIVKYSSSNDNLVLVNENTGEVTLTNNALMLLEPQTITIYATINNDTSRVFSYDITVYYKAFTTIKSVEFNKENVVINTYFETTIKNDPVVVLKNEGLDTKDFVKFSSSNTHLVLVNESTGEITLTDNALMLLEPQTITIYATVNNDLNRRFSYSIVIYYEEPLTSIKQILFDKDEITINTYYVSYVHNLATIVLEDENLKTEDKIIFTTSDSNLVIIDENTGEINTTIFAYFLDEVKVIAITATVIGTNRQFSYNLSLYYEEPLTFISNIVFENSVVKVNTYYTDSLEFVNRATIILDEVYLQTNETVEYSSSNTEFVVVNKNTGLVQITEQVLMLLEPQTVTIYATIIGGDTDRVFSYVIEIKYNPPLTYIKDVLFEHSEITVNSYHITEVENPATIVLQNPSLATNDTYIFMSGNIDLVEVDELTGHVTLTPRAKLVSRLETVKIYVFVSGYSNKEFTYSINIYFEEPLTSIIDVLFEHDEIEINTFYETKIENSATFVLQDPSLRTNDIVEFYSTNMYLVNINIRTGEVTLTENALRLEREEYIGISAVVNNKFYYYNIKIYYKEPLTTIKEIVFEQTEITANPFSVVEIFNPAKIVLEQEGFKTEEIVRYYSNNTSIAKVNEETGVVTLEKQSLNQTVTITAMVVGTDKQFSYVIHTEFEIIYDEILDVEFEQKSFYIEVTDEWEVNITNKVIINNNQEGFYNNSLINYSYPENISLFRHPGEVRLIVVGRGEFVVSLTVEGTDIVRSFVINVVAANEVDTFEGLIFAIETYSEVILKADIVLPNNYQTIPQLSAVINGNGYNISNIQTILFNTINENAAIKNLTLDFDVKNKFVANGGNIFASVAIYNYGKIENVSARVNLQASTINNYLVSGMVFYNYGYVMSSSILLNAQNTGSGSSQIGAFAYKNEKEILDCEVVYGSEIKGFSVVAGFVYENNFIIQGCTTNLTIHVPRNGTAVGFVFENKGSRSLGVTAYLINNKAFVNYMLENSSSQAFGFVVLASYSTFRDSEMVFYASRSISTPLFILSASNSTIMEYEYSKSNTKL